MHCPYCGQNHPDKTKFCPETGKSLSKVIVEIPTDPAAVPGSRKTAKGLFSPVTLIIVGTIIVAGLLLALTTYLNNRAPILPKITQDVPATLAAIVNQTSMAQVSPSLQIPATATMTIVPPTMTFTMPAPTAYVPPTRTPMAGAYKACPNAFPSVLHKGDVAQVSLDPPVENNLRDKAGTDSPITGALEPGEIVDIVGGPDCMGVFVWWSVVSRSSGRAGWTAEGDWNNYWLVKVQ